MGVSAEFSAPFRAQVASWLSRIAAPRPGEPVRVYSLGKQRLLVAWDVDMAAGTCFADVVVALGNVRLGERCELSGPVFARGGIETGKQCRLMAVAAGARLMVGAGTRVSDWADAQGEMLLRAGAVINGPARARRIELASEASARSLFAPEIDFGCGAHANPADAPPRTLVTLSPPSGGHEDYRYWRTVPGFRAEKLTALDARTWFYDGSLHFVSPLDLRGHLIVRGSFQCAEGSLLEGDVKAGAGLRVGAASLVRGQLISLDDLVLGERTYFSGDLQAAGDLTLAQGARGFHPQRPVRVECKGTLTGEHQAVIRGEAHAHQKIQATPYGLEPREDLLQYREIC